MRKLAFHLANLDSEDFSLLTMYLETDDTFLLAFDYDWFNPVLVFSAAQFDFDNRDFKLGSTITINKHTELTFNLIVSGVLSKDCDSILEHVKLAGKPEDLKKTSMFGKPVYKGDELISLLCVPLDVCYVVDDTWYSSTTDEMIQPKQDYIIMDWNDAVNFN